MNICKRLPVTACVAVPLFVLLALLLTAPAGAQPITNSVFFTNNITLDGDISDFFLPDGLTLRPGVCLANDPNGLDESPVDSMATIDVQMHPSGFNQRRIMTAFNPNLNGGTIFIGIDLPGGVGADNSSKITHSFVNNPNPNYFDGVVGQDGGGNGFGRGKIVPFDADANGEADAIGRKADGSLLFRCTGLQPADTRDIVTCLGGANGLTDNPRTASGETLGARENYVATVMFGNGEAVTVELFQAASTPGGTAVLAVCAPADSSRLRPAH